mmetsp:Transcript_10645/g.35231  ORF Transcript_10645/g.35231 Transcript_10645/m.35231 type:complete len:232 (-) Transcript_10645:70-765(-)
MSRRVPRRCVVVVDPGRPPSVPGDTCRRKKRACLGPRLGLGRLVRLDASPVDVSSIDRPRGTCFFLPSFSKVGQSRRPSQKDGQDDESEEAGRTPQEVHHREVPGGSPPRPRQGPHQPHRQEERRSPRDAPQVGRRKPPHRRLTHKKGPSEPEPPKSLRPTSEPPPLTARRLSHLPIVVASTPPLTSRLSSFLPSFLPSFLDFPLPLPLHPELSSLLPNKKAARGKGKVRS